MTKSSDLGKRLVCKIPYQFLLLVPIESTQQLILVHLEHLVVFPYGWAKLVHLVVFPLSCFYLHLHLVGESSLDGNEEHDLRYSDS
jgi:hypothetical protein